MIRATFIAALAVVLIILSVWLIATGGDRPKSLPDTTVYVK